MKSSRIWLSALGFCALTIGCGDAGARHAIQMARVEPPAQPVTSVDAVTPAELPGPSGPTRAVQTPASRAGVTATSAPDATSVRTGAFPVLNQMLTTQALLVSLLLTPFSHEQPGGH